MTKIDICNHALLKVGADTIASLDINQNDAEGVIYSAKLCNILFQQALDETVRMYEWNTCKKREQLVRSSEAPAFKFKYKYQLPNACIRVINLYDSKEGYDDGTVWTIEGDEILCNYESAFLSYVASPEDVSILDSLATQVLILNLAIKLSVPLQLDQKIQNNLIQELQQIVLPLAKSVDTLENKYWNMEESNWLNSIYNDSPVI